MSALAFFKSSNLCYTLFLLTIPSLIYLPPYNSIHMFCFFLVIAGTAGKCQHYYHRTDSNVASPYIQFLQWDLKLIPLRYREVYSYNTKSIVTEKSRCDVTFKPRP